MLLVAHGQRVTSSRQIIELKSNAEPGQYVDGWPVFESHCQPCAEVLGKPLISCRFCLPSRDGYLVEQNS